MGCAASKGSSNSNAVVIVPQLEWPPKADADELVSGREITLPESIYWDYILPFTPTKDRVVVNKRCTTAFYAGRRVELDETYLQRYARGKGKVLFRNGSFFSVFWCLPVARGQPGSNQFHVEVYHNSSSNDDHCAIDPEVAIEKLRLCRRKWDEHMSLIPYPHKRLQACLEELESNGMYVSFLFDNNGTIDDVVKFHASVNLLALNGPVTRALAQNEVDIFPNTPLGLWVTRWLTHIMSELEGRMYMEYEEGEIVRCNNYEEEVIVAALLDAGADATVFFEPLSDYPYHTISVLTLLEAASSGHAPAWEPGMSLHEVMRNNLLWFKRHEHIFGCVCGFQDILERLASKSKVKLRFDVGSWVECNVGCQHHHEWIAGVVTSCWINGGQPYIVTLEEGSVYVPVDTDEFIRVPTLRFQVGDRVECKVYGEDDWVSGIVVEQWPESDKGRPYKILLHDEEEICVAKIDTDNFIRAQIY